MSVRLKRSIVRFGILVLISFSLIWFLRTQSDEYKVQGSSSNPAFAAGGQCDDDCARFRRLLTPVSRGGSWPDDKPRAAIVVLLGKWTHISGMNDASGSVFAAFVENIDRYFNNHFDYPLIAFYNASDPNTTVHQRRSVPTRSKVFLQAVDFSIPPFINVSLVDDERCWGLKMNDMGYRSMCRFQAKTVYEQEIMRTDTLDFVWRLDDDSQLTANVTVDPIRTMRDGHYKYGYRDFQNETMRCAIGLWPTVEQYWNKLGVRSRFDIVAPQCFFNNFELSDMSLWRSKAYVDYINYIDSLGEFYYSRWGDSPIKSLAVNRLVSWNEVHQFKDIGYQHGDHNLRHYGLFK